MKISKPEFARRRRRLMGLMEPNSIAIIPSASEQLRSRDTSYPFRQDSDFHYLCGFPEPEAVLVLMPEREHGEFVLFCRERDMAMELWHGYRAGPEGACSGYGADDAFPISDIDDILPGLIEGRERVYYSMGRSAGFDHRIMAWVNQIRSKEASGAVPPGEFTDLDHMLHDLRLKKSAAELRLMQRAGDITAAAHCRAMRNARAGLYEYQLEADMLHEFARGGARFPAYPSIVGSGPNSCILHYTENARAMRSGELVLIDAGCEYQCYAADVTRTFPVSGRFSSPQRAIYMIVLEAQLAAINAIYPGNHWNAPHQATLEVITRGLRDLGLLQGEVDELIEQEAYREFYMHRAGHWLGLDVHDVGDYQVAGEWRQLEAGMVLTVEPGIYIAPDNSRVAPRWRGIGVRIEDDVVVTASGHHVLTDNAPRHPDQIEALMAAGAS
ncbi:Xaa-Pro aminopeptidase [Kineobactrum sediminis]|uniref:Xaa-Pro aminopeptidase n=1 Tax=Kineobactrum sediminis TaxID=1905677 RepID=A0A2N5Y583_9GAMM|nr:Xaa-Pro aminopeptidase [Kineobactrum sediminis]PLW83548.1 Xaa-Pro aminopeptidase [Kineobactrum sediminis]